MHLGSGLHKKAGLLLFLKQVGISEVKFGRVQVHAVMFLVPDIEPIQTSLCLSEYPPPALFYTYPPSYIKTVYLSASGRFLLL